MRCDVVGVLLFGHDAICHPCSSLTFQVRSFFCLPWVLTWFSHNLDRLSDNARLFDFLLASHPLMPMYVAVALIHDMRTGLLACDCEYAAVHGYFQKLPKVCVLDHVHVYRCSCMSNGMYERERMHVRRYVLCLSHGMDACVGCAMLHTYAVPDTGCLHHHCTRTRTLTLDCMPCACQMSCMCESCMVLRRVLCMVHAVLRCDAVRCAVIRCARVHVTCSMSCRNTILRIRPMNCMNASIMCRNSRASQSTHEHIMACARQVHGMWNGMAWHGM